MVFKGRFFSSKKSTDSSSSPDGSNSPRTPTLDSPNRSDKKKVKPSSSSSSSSSPSSSFRHSLLYKKNDAKSKDKDKDKDKDSSPTPAAAAAAASAPAKLRKGTTAAAAVAAGDGSLSPILASSLGLNRIKTRSGPLPQDSGHRMSGLGSSNLGRMRNDGGSCSTSAASSSSKMTLSAAAGKSSGKKKDARGLEKVPETSPSTWGEQSGGGSRGKDWVGESRFRSQIGNGDATASADFGMVLFLFEVLVNSCS